MPLSSHVRVPNSPLGVSSPRETAPVVRYLQPPVFALKLVPLIHLSVVIGVNDLPNPGLFRSLPDPFAVVIVDGEEIHTTKVLTKTLRGNWREDVDL